MGGKSSFIITTNIPMYVIMHGGRPIHNALMRFIVYGSRYEEPYIH